MTQQAQTQPRPLCPHLAAAVLWMSKNSRATRRDKTLIRHGRAYRQVMDDLLAL